MSRDHYLLVSGTAVVASVLGCLLMCFLARLLSWLRAHKQRVRLQRKGITVFVSYRVAADKDLAMRLWNKLTNLSVEVWWDSRCLEDGANWEHGFVQGLVGSQVFVPILSEGAIRNFASLTDDSPCDNLLLELRLALERNRTGDLKAIMPIFVGDVFAAISTLAIAESAIPSVERAVQKHLGNAYIEGMSPRAVLQAIMKFQGTFVKRSTNVRQAVSNIAELVRLLGERRRQGDEQRPTKVVTLLSLVCHTSFRKACSRCTRRLRALCGCCSGPTLDVSQSVGFKAEEEDPIGEQRKDESNPPDGENEDAPPTCVSVLLPHLLFHLLMRQALDPISIRRACMGLCWTEQAVSRQCAQEPQAECAAFT